ncbi:hypothetical protein AAVH_21822 [Aphelenchoides avenae]|nr:hypothetical protein AAVH_21822 [Aphelenchus avenae]
MSDISDTENLEHARGGNSKEDSGGKATLVSKRKSTDVATDHSSPAKIEKLDESGGGVAEGSDAGVAAADCSVGDGSADGDLVDVLSNNFDIDLDNLGDDDDAQPIASWSSSLKNVTVRAQFIYVKLNKDGRDGKEVFSVLIEDDTDKTNVVAFGDHAKKLRTALVGHEGAVVLFTKLHSRAPQPDYERFLPGKVRWELLFEKVSEAKIVAEGTGNMHIESLRDLAAGTGAVKADLRMVAITKFTNFNHSASGTPRYLGLASDGNLKVELEMPFAPPFSAGDEFRMLSVTGRKSGGKIYLFIAKPADVEKVIEDKKIPRQLKNLYFVFEFFECDG